MPSNLQPEPCQHGTRRYPSNWCHRLLSLNEPLKDLRGMPYRIILRRDVFTRRLQLSNQCFFSLVRRRRGVLNLLFFARETSLTLSLCGFTYSQDIVSTSDVHSVAFPYIIPVGTIKRLKNYRLLNRLSKEISLILNAVRHSCSNSGYLHYHPTFS